MKVGVLLACVLSVSACATTFEQKLVVAGERCGAFGFDTTKDEIATAGCTERQVVLLENREGQSLTTAKGVVAGVTTVVVANKVLTGGL